MMRKWKRRIRRFLKFLILGDSQRKKDRMRVRPLNR